MQITFLTQGRDGWYHADAELDGRTILLSFENEDELQTMLLDMDFDTLEVTYE